jgi:hypothetical protein
MPNSTMRRIPTTGFQFMAGLSADAAVDLDLTG